MKTFKSGDRVGYSAACLRNSAIHTGPLPQRRGTVRANEHKTLRRAFVSVDWDDFNPAQWQSDYAAEIAAHGSGVSRGNLAKIGSSDF